MDSPKHLKHKPIISVNNYNKIDGKFSNNTDAEALSIGMAQYDNTDISAKVWRYDRVNDKWSRQSEELPLHRVLDLSILTIASFIKDSESDYPISNLMETYDGFENVKNIQRYYEKNKAKLKPRIDELERLIKEYRKIENKNYSNL
jgi:Zn-dependent M32 family carboxypeptidase